MVFEDRAPLAPTNMCRAIVALAATTGSHRTDGARRRAGPAGRWFGYRRQRRHVVHADRDRQRQPRQSDRVHLRALRRARERRWAPRGPRPAVCWAPWWPATTRLDYAVIQFDPQKVRPVNNVKGFQIDGIGPDPTFGDIACKLGPDHRLLVRRHVGPGRGARAPSSTRCAVSRATPGRRSRSTTSWSA